MGLEQIVTQEQRLILTQTMRQALECLEMPVIDLCDYLQEQSLSNPLLEVEMPAPGSIVPPRPAPQAESDDEDTGPVQRRERLIWDGQTAAEPADLAEYTSSHITYREHLDMQLQLMKGLDPAMEALCHYLVGCLNSAGYLDCPLPELAQELGCSQFDLEQALFAVQSLDPPGTGARNLSECLLLQLAEGKDFTAVNIHLVRLGLPLLAEKDYTGLAKLLNVSRKEVLQAAEVIRSLNPIPSRGFYSERTLPYILPEATVLVDHGEPVVEMNTYGIPRLSLRQDYCDLLESGESGEAQSYLKEKLTDAKSVLARLEKRQDTLFRLICAVVNRQRAYFLNGAELQPLTMKQVAEELEVNVSTISRAVKDKYIQFQGRTLPLRSLFCASMETGSGACVSADFIHKQMRRFLAAENPLQPLSDDALAEALNSIGIPVSRRTVAKYRSELGIPTAAARKRSAREESLS